MRLPGPTRKPRGPGAETEAPGPEPVGGIPSRPNRFGFEERVSFGFLSFLLVLGRVRYGIQRSSRRWIVDWVMRGFELVLVWFDLRVPSMEGSRRSGGCFFEHCVELCVFQ